ncbi:MAG TPA: c-type cytochrome biogenesis protein CcmI [Burkholderiales bacterium]|nr:c-type cytochrome biogenesis protein CcmI [Burkholderiales bacterium]
MTPFLIIGTLLAAGALLVVVLPLLRQRNAGRVSRSVLNIAVYRDQLRELDADVRAGTLSAEQYGIAKKELEARMLEDVDAGDAAANQPKRERATAIALGLALPLCAAALYLVVGNPQALTPELSGSAHEVTPQQIEQMVQRLAARLESNPDDTEGWVMLARSYSVLGRFEQAAAAYANAAKRSPNDAQLLADYADVLAMAQGRRLEGEPEKLIVRALEIEPDNIKALALAGSVAFEKKDYAKAVDHWQRVAGLLPPDSEMVRSVNASIDEARALGKGGALPVQQPARRADSAAGKGSVSGVVKLAPELAAKAAPTDTVFIFARAAAGPRMPLAILRRQVSELPVSFQLDDTMAMAQGMSLSSFPQVVVGARISKSANATPHPGDLEGFSKPIPNHATGVTVVISNEVR